MLVYQRVTNGIILPIDFHIFQRGRLNHQPGKTKSNPNGGHGIGWLPSAVVFFFNGVTWDVVITMVYDERHNSKNYGIF